MHFFKQNFTVGIILLKIKLNKLKASQGQPRPPLKLSKKFRVGF